MTKRDVYIIFGPPGSGKTALAKYIAKTLGLENISWGEITRDKSKRNKYKNLFKFIENETIDNGKRSDYISEIIETEISNRKCKTEGIILDGYPKRVKEAKLLIKITEKHGLKIKTLIRINPSVKKAFERFNKRHTCSICLRHYDDELNAPKKQGFCDFDNSKLENRYRSQEDIRKDFYQYLEESNPAYDYLKKYSESHFDVSGEDDDIVIFSNILLKIKLKERSDYVLFDKKSNARLETEYGTFKIYVYQSRIDYSYHFALVKGKVKRGRDVLVRVHSSCITGDIFSSKKCDCGQQLHESMRLIGQHGRGILVYLFQEGRGINIINKINAYRLQNRGLDTIEANEKLGFPAELREYVPVRDILKDLEVETIILMTNNPDKIRKLTDLGIVINDALSLEIKPCIQNERYLRTKKAKMDHRLKFV